ncbi:MULTISPECIES: ATP-binding protein [unclassified Pseudoalteromonas]|uniref:sensor histidine kinase n=2 Tax=Pseudoalteromonas TaxID=53246 RepID=UPI0010227082|nr:MULTISPECIES: ATP-binding protein [unclassified Pseudoalteromonas]NIZ05957.1 sensor histidine kinase [Pseudoalteromonas sp. HF66]QLE09867.1 sensor histidine kinase [Pseudoalteromonas shioyasakiensis]RZD22309.1 sensor histidine kinase [Pseudoalteromonas sp. MEBiC 03485]
MKSIRSKLVTTLSITITGLVLSILVATDIAVDSWIDNEFNRGMKSKAGMLMTLVHEDEEGLTFNFSSDFMPEFDGQVEPEYFQMWTDDGVFTRSQSLNLFALKNLKFEKLKLGEAKIMTTELPDGRDGRIIYTRFQPQIDSHSHRNFFDGVSKTHHTTLTLAYAASSEKVDFILWLIDVIFVVSTVSVIVFIRLFVRKSVDSSLAPLNKLNRDISRLSIADKSAVITIKEPVKELQPIVDSLNAFIQENRQLYFREKRLTSDIAHELKTPIAELINMAEVAIRFPNEKEFEADFKPEVLKISQRLKSIVSNLLLLHKYSDEALPKQDACDLNQVILRTLEKCDLEWVKFEFQDDIPAIVSNLFALESIITNLVNNAKQYSPEKSIVTVSSLLNKKGKLQFSVTNELKVPLTDEDISQLFDPLWQKDSARTSEDNFGLGLSIAKALSKAIDAELQVSLSEQNITFSLIIS